MLAAYVGIAIMAVVILRVGYLMCKNSNTSQVAANQGGVRDNELRQPLQPQAQQAYA